MQRGMLLVCMAAAAVVILVSCSSPTGPRLPGPTEPPIPPPPDGQAMITPAAGLPDALEPPARA